MKRSELRQQVAKALDVDEVGDDFNFSASEEYDSLAVMSMVAMLNKAFGITLKAADLQNLTTLDSLVALIGKDRVEND